MCGSSEEPVDVWANAFTRETDSTSGSPQLTFIDDSVKVGIYGNNTRLVLDPMRDTRYQGWVETNLYNSSTYERICGDNFGINEAKAVCSSLGLPSTGASYAKTSE